MKLKIFSFSLLIFVLTSCGGFNKLLKSPDSDYKYEAAKQYIALGKYTNASYLLDDVLAGMKGTEKGDESLFLSAMCKYKLDDFVTANEQFKKFYSSYPTSTHVDEARFYAAKSLYLSTPQPQLDQTDTYQAITELQNFLEVAPESKYAPTVRSMIFELQDKLIEKEFLAAKLYYNLGGYFGNCTMGGNNYEACIITAQNAIKDYPYSDRKEDFSILILEAKYQLAVSSIQNKMRDRYNEAIDEYYGFLNEFPKSKYTKIAQNIFDKSKEATKSL